MNFLTRWWNRRKLKVELPKPEPLRICDVCFCEATMYCRKHAEFFCARCGGFHLEGLYKCTGPYYSVRSAAELMTGKVR